MYRDEPCCLLVVVRLYALITFMDTPTAEVGTLSRIRRFTFSCSNQCCLLSALSGPALVEHSCPSSSGAVLLLLQYITHCSSFFGFILLPTGQLNASANGAKLRSGAHTRTIAGVCAFVRTSLATYASVATVHQLCAYE